MCAGLVVAFWAELCVEVCVELYVELCVEVCAELFACCVGAACFTASGFGTATGAGASGSTPLMMGVCLLVGSCERRVTPVGSSISSAIL